MNVFQRLILYSHKLAPYRDNYNQQILGYFFLIKNNCKIIETLQINTQTNVYKMLLKANNVFKSYDLKENLIKQKN